MASITITELRQRLTALLHVDGRPGYLLALAVPVRAGHNACICIIMCVYVYICRCFECVCVCVDIYVTCVLYEDICPACVRVCACMCVQCSNNWKSDLLLKT